MQFPTAAAFITWLLTPAGLGLAVVLLVAAARRLPEPPASDRQPWYARLYLYLYLFINHQTLLFSIAIAAVVALLDTLARDLGWIAFLEPYWPTVILVWAVSQALYNAARSSATLKQALNPADFRSEAVRASAPLPDRQFVAETNWGRAFEGDPGRQAASYEPTNWPPESEGMADKPNP